MQVYRKSGKQSDNEKINKIKSYKGWNILQSYAGPRPEGTRHIIYLHRYTDMSIHISVFTV